MPQKSHHLSENQTPVGGFRFEAAETFFEDLSNALTWVPNYRKIYSVYNIVFHRVVNDKTSTTSIVFSGTFAKTDYLLKEYSASKVLVRNTNDTRIRLKNLSDCSDSDLKRLYLKDLRNICQLIAFLYNSCIPESLTALFPKQRTSKAKPLLMKDSIRVTVQNWDTESKLVWCKAEDSVEDETLTVNYANNTLYNYDWTYLESLFYQYAQLNLIRPIEKDGVVYPELIIFEPDYLVDISAVANCFTNYADSPYVHLIKKLNKSETTEPILLGNLAGQLLDEAIHQLPDSHTYRQSVMDFFKNNAVNLLTVETGADFHQEAQQQKQNIHNAIHVALPQAVKSFNSKEGIVEPSFFSEMLGLQGRMDFLQLDYKVLMEQKSGKADFPYDDFKKPKTRVDHYVQILLYMTLIRYNFRERYEENERELHSFLLYSKYKQSLDGVGFAPELLFKAIKVRNGIAWAELKLFSQPNGYRFLERATAETFNQKQVKDKLWINYQKPQIEEFLAPLKNASELEKAYYFRFLTFVANEHLMAKLGNKTKENSGFSSIWHDSLEDKKNAGNIYDNLKLISPSDSTKGKIESVTLGFNESENYNMSNFRVGDIVILYPYAKGLVPDARKTMVFRCSIQDIHTDTICLHLRAAQSDNRVFLNEKGKLWAIEHDFIESSYSSTYRAFHAFLSAPKPRRDLLLLQRTPDIDPSLSLKGEYGMFNDLMLKVKRAKDLFLIIGPPGTGKTSFGLLYTVKEELLEPDSNILLLAYTNRAVDEICSKLVEEGIDFVRVGSLLNCAEEYRDKLLSSRAENSNNIDEVRSMVDNIRVFVGTVTAFGSNLQLFKIKQFNLAVIDEASQILEPNLMGILSAKVFGTPVVRKIVMIGDYKQLPAVVKQGRDMSEVQEPMLRDIHLTDCRLSLFQRLMKRYGDDENLTYLLNRQGRMHHDIALFPNYSFYGNRLEEVPRPHQNVQLPIEGDHTNGIDDLLKTRRAVFLAAEPPKDSVSDKVNQTEADMIAATIVRIYELNKEDFDENRTVGVIVPYRNQIATVRNTLAGYGIQRITDITIDTVERFQGSQRKYIIYGFTVQRLYQLDFLTNNVFEDMDGTIVDCKLNVAMTRAEEHLIIIGNPYLLSKNYIFLKLIEFMKHRHDYFEIKRDDYVKGNFMIPKFDVL